MLFFVRKIQGNKYGLNSINEMGWEGTEQVTVEEPNPDMLPSNIESLNKNNYLPVLTGRAGEVGAYILADSQDEALEWARKRL